MARRLFLFVAAIAALSGSAPAVAVVSGEQRLLVIRATWGPKPFSTEQVQENVADVDAFFRRSSFGVVTFTGVVTPWLHAYEAPPTCNAVTLSYDADAVARQAGYNPAAYDEIAYLFPATNDCPWPGMRWGKRVLLNGTLTLTNTAHELGHVLGLPHANAWSCVPRPCGIINLGDPYDTMGNGTGDFDSYEKWLLGWIQRVTFASRPGVYRIAPLEEPSTQPQGFVVTTARNRYWFEVRRKPARDESGAIGFAGGLLVHAGPSPTVSPDRPRYGILGNVLLLDPIGRGSPQLRPGDRFGEHGAFSIVVRKGIAPLAQLRFSWTDTKPPGRPEIILPKLQSRRAPPLAVEWRDSVEEGSGIDRYIVSLDGAAPRTIPQSAYPGPNALQLGELRSGPHTVKIVAVDRAGNRSAPAVRRFVVDRN